MAGAKTGSNKKHTNQRTRMLDGKKVIAVLYNGRALGHGKYFTGEVDNKLICDDNGKPLPIKEIGNLI